MGRGQQALFGTKGRRQIGLRSLNQKGRLICAVMVIGPSDGAKMGRKNWGLALILAGAKQQARTDPRDRYFLEMARGQRLIKSRGKKAEARHRRGAINGSAFSPRAPFYVATTGQLLTTLDCFFVFFARNMRRVMPGFDVTGRFSEFCGNRRQTRLGSCDRSMCTIKRMQGG